MRTTNHVGHTCMHKAAQLGHLDFVKYLVEELGIEPKSVEPDGEGHSPADLAREARHDELAAWLDAYGGKEEDGGAERGGELLNDAAAA